MNKVELVGMQFYAHHGHFEEEQIIGNKFIVDFWAEADLSVPARTDNLNDALNYQEVYNVIREQMAVKSFLLEHVARRILDAVKAKFPYIVNAQVSIAKLNPPMGGQVYASRITMDL